MAPKVEKQVTKSKKQKKDPNAPKKALSAYMLWTSANREAIKSKYPDLKVTEIMKKLGEEWQKAPEAEKKTFEGKAEKDKARYEKELATYKKSSEYAEFQANKGKKAGKADKVKRAPSSFMIYSNEVRASVQAKNPAAKLGDVAKIIGGMWKELSEGEKAKYTKKSEEAKNELAKSQPAASAPAKKAAAAAPAKKAAAPAKAAPAAKKAKAEEPEEESEEEESEEEESEEEEDSE